MERHINEHEEVDQGPEHYEGRSQSDWDGSCVVITRKEDKGRQESLEAVNTLRKPDA
jgi:hypothetical protein